VIRLKRLQHQIVNFRKLAKFGGIATLIGMFMHCLAAKRPFEVFYRVWLSGIHAHNLQPGHPHLLFTLSLYLQLGLLLLLGAQLNFILLMLPLLPFLLVGEALFLFETLFLTQIAGA